MFSLAFFIAGATAFVIRGDRNFGVDFKGGDLLSLSAAKSVQVAQMREALKPIHLDNEPIQQSLEGNATYITIRTPINTSDQVNRAIREHIPKGNSRWNEKSVSARWSAANWREIPFWRSVSVFSES